MLTPCRALLAGTALSITALVLTACDGISESIGQSWAESDARARAARYAAQGNPQFDNPELQAIVQDFEAKYAVIGVDPEKLGLAEGKPCPVTKETAFRVLKGISYENYMAAQAASAAQMPGFTAVSDLDAIKLVSLSGVCDENGPEGTAIVVGTTRDILRRSGEYGTTVTVTDTAQRIEATWVDGQRTGSVTSISISQSAQFKPGEDGSLEVDVDDWDYINEMREAPSALYMYLVNDDAGNQKYSVTFSRNPTTGDYGTFVFERIDDTYGYGRNWLGNELIREGGTKNGRAHGWQITHPIVWDGTPLPGSRDCYQDGELIKALECPSR